MSLQLELASLLLEIPDVQPAALGKSKLFLCGSKEIARLREGGFIDICLTQPLITALGLVGDESAPGWVQISFKESRDLPAAVTLVQRAVRAAKITD